MTFNKEDFNNCLPFSQENILTEEELIKYISIGANKVKIPLGLIKHIDERNRKETKVMYTLDELRSEKCKTDRDNYRAFFNKSIKKYINGNVEFKYPFYGDKLMKQQYFKNKQAEFQQYLLEKNAKYIMIAHEDCGYEFRADADSPVVDYCDFICNGTNDTEIIQQAINMYPDDLILIHFFEDEYVLKPTSGSGTEDDPYICLNIDRNHIILRGNNRKTNFTFDHNIVNDTDKIYLINSTGTEEVVSSNINFCMEDLDIYWEELAFPEPSEKILRIKEKIENTPIYEHEYTIDELKKMIEKEG